MQPHCPAQDALLKVHERISEEDELYGGLENDDDDDTIVTSRLLVPSDQVGCLLGKGGNVIQNLRTETGANIRILHTKYAPACALSTDELVQITGISAVAKRALYEVSTLLHHNPHKDNPLPNHTILAGGPGFYPPFTPMTNMPPAGSQMWSHRNSGAHGPWSGGYGNHSSGFVPGGYSGGETGDFFMKIRCSNEKVGLVIGKGGCHVNQIERETGANIRVQDMTPNSSERAILVSAYEALWNPRSQTIEAIIQLQNKTSEISENSTITARLLVPSSKIGCLLGQGGHVITEMRRQTQADIRVYSKHDKPKCASSLEELVQIFGKSNVAKDALSEVASRLRVRFLRDENSGQDLVYKPFQGFGASRRFPEWAAPQPPPPPPAPAPPASGMIGAGFGGYEQVKSYPFQPTSMWYPNVNNSMEITIPNNAVDSVIGTGGRNIANISEISGARVKLRDPWAGGSECVVEIHGSLEQMNAAQNLLQTYITSAVQKFNTQQSTFQY